MPIRFQVDPDFYDHPKSIGMSDAATALWVRAGSYSAAKLLDGFIAEHVLPTLSRTPDAAAAELVARGLWKRVKGGYRFHQYEERNLTKARVQSDREHERDRKARQRAGSKTHPQKPVDEPPDPESSQSSPTNVPPGHPPDNQWDSGRIPGGVSGVSVSVSGSMSVSGSGHAASGEQEPPAKCEDHQHLSRPPNCGYCADARKANEAWHANKRDRIATAAKCDRHTGELAHNCRACASEQKAASNGRHAALEEETQALRVLRAVPTQESA